jgi:hypothetical protein
MKKIICEFCNKEFSIKGIFCHKERMHLGLNSKYSNGYNGKYDTKEFKERSKKSIEYRLGSIEDHKKICKKCGEEFIWRGRKTSVEFEKEKFCGYKCSNARVHTDESNKKLSALMIAKADVKGRKLNSRYLVYKCVICLSDFKTSGYKKLCSEQCRKIYFERKRQKFLEQLPEIKRYRTECKFQFLLRDFPKEFDFQLLSKHGMYSAKNHGNNMKGISRDHMVSISFGFENKIPAKIISHPANCQLLLQSHNAAKKTRCAITIEELMERIENWDKKYNMH